MDPLIVARIQPSLEAHKTKGAPIRQEGHSISSNGSSFAFRKLYNDGSSQDIYNDVGRPLAQSLVDGYNVAIILAGETAADGQDLLEGRSSVLSFLLQDLFTHLNNIDGFEITISAAELAPDSLTDLLDTTKRSLSVAEDPEYGYHIAGITKLRLRNVRDAQKAIDDAAASRNDRPAEACHNATCYIIKILHGDVIAEGRVVLLPGLEALGPNAIKRRLREGAEASRGLLTLNSIVDGIASGRDKAVDVSVCRRTNLTKLMYDVVGSNCQLAMILSVLSTETVNLPAVLDFTRACSKIKCYPVLNNALMRGLLRQHRQQTFAFTTLEAKIGGEDGSAYTVDFEAKLAESKVETLTLKAEQAKLLERLKKLKHRSDRLAAEKLDLNTALVQSEEERLDVSKALIDMQIETNQVKERAETQAQADMNTIMNLRAQLEQLQTAHDDAVQELTQLKSASSKLAEDRESLMSNYTRTKTELEGLKAGQASEATWIRQLEQQAKAITDTKIQVIQERDQYARQLLVAAGSLPTSLEVPRVVASQFDMKAVEQELSQLQRTIRERYNLQQSTSPVDSKASAKEALQAERRANELRQELGTARSSLEQLTAERARMLASHTAYVQEHRQRLEGHVAEFSQWMESSDLPSAEKSQNLSHRLEAMCKDHNLAYAQLEKELQASLSHVEAQLKQAKGDLVHQSEAHAALRRQCELRGIDVGPACKIELVNYASDKEDQRLREALSELTVQRDQLLEQLFKRPFSSSNSGRTDMLERERATLLAAKARAEERASQLQVLLKKYITEQKRR